MAMPDSPPKNLATPFASMTGHHVGLRVPDFEGSKKWFVDKLDWRVVHEWPSGGLRAALIGPPADDTFFVELLGGGDPRLRRSYPKVTESLVDSGYHHFCLTVDSVDGAVAELRRRGVAIVGEPAGPAEPGLRQAFFADPWGNVFELAQILP